MLLHFAQIVICFAVIGTHGSDNGLAHLIAHAIGDSLLVNFAFLAEIATKQLALIEACKKKKEDSEFRDSCILTLF